MSEPPEESFNSATSEGGLPTVEWKVTTSEVCGGLDPTCSSLALDPSQAVAVQPLASAFAAAMQHVTTQRSPAVSTALSATPTADCPSTVGWESASVASSPLENEKETHGESTSAKHSHTTEILLEQPNDVEDDAAPLDPGARSFEIAFNSLVHQGEHYWNQQWQARSGKSRRSSASSLWMSHIRKTLSRVIRSQLCSHTAFVCALVLIYRLSALQAGYVCAITARRVLVAALVVSAKMFDDTRHDHTISDFAQAAALSVETVKFSEVQLLTRLEYCAFIQEKEYEKVSALIADLVPKEIGAKGHNI